MSVAGDPGSMYPGPPSSQTLRLLHPLAEDGQSLSSLPHSQLFWGLDGGQGSRVGTLSLLPNGWLNEAGVMTSLAISFLVKQRGRAGRDLLGPRSVPPALPRHGELNISRGYLGSARSDLSSQSPWACSSHSPLCPHSSSHGNLATRGEDSLSRGVQASNRSFPYQGFRSRSKQGKHVIAQENHCSEKVWLRT